MHFQFLCSFLTDLYLYFPKYLCFFVYYYIYEYVDLSLYMYITTYMCMFVFVLP